MQLLIAFLFGTFVVGGLTGRAHGRRKSFVLLGACVVVGVMFYSGTAP